MDLLDFARGPAIQVATAIFLLGVTWRLLGVLLLPWMFDKSKPREGVHGAWYGALAANVRRMWPYGELLRSAPFSTINGYVFHIGLAIVAFGLAPHILYIKSITGLSWPPLPNNIVYGAGMITMASLFAALTYRLSSPVMKLISSWDDYFSWFVTITPVITGLAAAAHFGGPYETVLAVHILSVALLLIWFPFGKLMHAFLFGFSRGVTGARFNHRGAKL